MAAEIRRQELDSKEEMRPGEACPKVKRKQRQTRLKDQDKVLEQSEVSKPCHLEPNSCEPFKRLDGRPEKGLKSEWAKPKDTWERSPTDTNPRVRKN